MKIKNKSAVLMAIIGICGMLLASCVREDAKSQIESGNSTVKETTPINNSFKTGSINPVNVAKDVIDDGYEERKRLMTEQLALKDFSTIIGGYYSEYEKYPSSEDSCLTSLQGIVSPMFCKKSEDCAFMAELPTEPTVGCDSGASYKVFDSGWDLGMFFVRKVSIPELANFKCSDFETATLEIFRLADQPSYKRGDFDPGINPDEWCEVFEA